MVNVFFVISGYVLSYKPLKQVYEGSSSSSNNNNGGGESSSGSPTTGTGTATTNSPKKSIAACHSTIASSILRRGIRLFLPTMIDTFICAILTGLGAFSPAIEVVTLVKQQRYYLDIAMPPKLPESSLWQELLSVLRTCWAYIDRSMIPWAERENLDVKTYDDVHWTIPIEFKCSIMLFVLLLATVSLRARYRLFVHGLACLYTFTNNRLDMFCFFAGMVLAEFDIRAALAVAEETATKGLSLLPIATKEEAAKPLVLSEPPSPTSPRGLGTTLIRLGRRLPGGRRLVRGLQHRVSSLPTALQIGGSNSSATAAVAAVDNTTTAWAVVFVIGLYLNVASLKPEARPSIGYSTVVMDMVRPLCGNSEPVEATRSLGAVLITWTAANTADTRIGSLFSNRVARYLGKISFGIYLTHLDVLRMLGISLLPLLYNRAAHVELLPDRYGWELGGGLSQWQIAKVVILGWLACLPFVLIAGHLFWYHIDRRVVHFSRYVEHKVTRPRP
jgi:hypothetical protein